MEKLAVCHTINPNSKTSGLFKHPLPYYKVMYQYGILFVDCHLSVYFIHNNNDLVGLLYSRQSYFYNFTTMSYFCLDVAQDVGTTERNVKK